MTNDMIEKFIEVKVAKHAKVNIFFKARNTMKGVFVMNNDYDELKSKNYWRIVTDSKIAEWEKSKDNNLAKLFSGNDFTKLSESNN